MTTKEYLGQISRLDRMIKNKLIELAQVRELTYGISAINTEDRVQTTPNFDKMGSAYCKIEQMEEEINNLVQRYTDEKSRIISQIDGIEDEMCYGILFARYIEKKTFERIASDNNYSFRNTTRLHGKALLLFEDKYGATYKQKK